MLGLQQYYQNNDEIKAVSTSLEANMKEQLIDLVELKHEELQKKFKPK